MLTRTPARLTRVMAMAAVPLLLASCAATQSATAAAAKPAACTTRTSLGAVAGTADGDLCAYRGIPYAQSPTGANRFRPPKPVKPWKGTLAATDGRRVCPQERDELSEDYPDKSKTYLNEDCLRLNVWSPKPDGKRHPVIVFIHGGAARFGTANEPRYDGAKLAGHGDAVVVSINYRLGVFGWSELGGLDPSYRGSGNNGLRDQMTALTWVRDHIANFGGDPRDVTAMGESEGAFSISAMLATAHPERLFRRAILESGSGYLVHSPAYEKRIAAGFPAHSVAEMRRMSTADLLKLQDKALQAAPGVGAALYFGPYVDGKLVRHSVIDSVRRGNARGIDVLIGTNKDELNFFGQGSPQALDAVSKQADDFFPKELESRHAKISAAYHRGRSARDAGLAQFTDQGMRIPAIRLAEAQNRWRPTYLYQFNWSAPKGYGAVHTAELPFVFGSLRFTGILGGDEALKTDRARITRLSNQMVDAWTSFARTGDPSARRLVSRPAWPSYRPAQRSTMIWDLHPRVANDPRGAERRLWNGYPFVAIDPR
ncbi:MAG TPA: carboxylesterase family protein [Streptosporangiaceae bacterium]|jgi:para-nitrobenzyl esterase